MPNKRQVGSIFLLMLAVSLFAPQGGTATPSSRITILTPGEGSILTSPINLSAEIHPDPSGLIRVTLTSRNGDLLARKLMHVDAVNGTTPIHFNTNLVFEIPSDNTEALMTLAIQDDTYRTISLRSVLVNLTSESEMSLQPMMPKKPWLEITQPQPLDNISGGQFFITGSVTPMTNRPILFELISESGRVVGSSILAVETPGEMLDFKIRLYYTYITKLTDVRLTVRQTLYPYNDIVILDSLCLTATP